MNTTSVVFGTSSPANSKMLPSATYDPLIKLQLKSKQKIDKYSGLIRTIFDSLTHCKQISGILNGKLSSEQLSMYANATAQAPF